MKHTAILLLCAGVAACSLAGPRFEPPPPDLAGSWQLDRAGSSDSVALAVAFPDTLHRRPDALFDSAGIQTRRVSRIRNAADFASLRAASHTIERLAIQRTSNHVVFVAGETAPVSIPLDGTNIETTWLDGQPCDVNARWRNGRLEVERTFADGTRLTEYYSRFPGTDRLVVYTRVKDIGLEFRRVYQEVGVQ